MEIIKFWKNLPKSKQPKCKSFESVVAAVEDELTLAKLKFFSFVASLLKPYLEKYQTDSPMLPFLNGDIKKLITNLLALVVKPEVLESYKTSFELMKINLDDSKIYVKRKDAHLGFATEQELSQLASADSVSFDIIN